MSVEGGIGRWIRVSQRFTYNRLASSTRILLVWERQTHWYHEMGSCNHG